MYDFLIAAHGHHLGPEAGNNWNRIRRENLSNGGLLPATVTQHFRAIISDVLFKDHFDNPAEQVNVANVEALRQLCLEAIQREFGS